MMITFSHRILTAVVGATIAVGVQALVPGAGPAAAVSSHADGMTVTQDAGSSGTPDKAIRYWTPDRMTAALQGTEPDAHEQQAPERRLVHQPAPGKRGKPSPTATGGLPPWLSGDTDGSGLRWTHGGSVAGAAGKVFFTLDDEDYVCSGALVGGADPDVVVTAAHCVSGGQRNGSPEWATNWMFVPGFADGVMPYGEYTANKFFLEPGWTGPQGGSEQYDVAFASVTAASLLGVSGALPTPGGLPLQFTKSQYAPVPGHAYVFGYPADPPFSGLYANFCAGPVGTSDGSARTACDMTAGDSGGPWLAGFSPRTGSGTVDAISTYKLSSNMRVLYGAVLGPQARTIYQQALAYSS